MSKDQSSDHRAMYEQGPELRSQNMSKDKGLRLWVKVQVQGSCLSLATNQSAGWQPLLLSGFSA